MTASGPGSVQPAAVATPEPSIAASGTDIVQNVVREVKTALEPYENVVGLELEERPGCSADAISDWEKRRAPARLPSDYVAFLRCSDGIDLRWRVRHCGKQIPLGRIHVSGLAALLPVPPAAFLDETGHMQSSLAQQRLEPLRAFELDASTPHGRVCLLYTGANQAQVPKYTSRRLPRDLRFVSITSMVM